MSSTTPTTGGGGGNPRPLVTPIPSSTTTGSIKTPPRPQAPNHLYPIHHPSIPHPTFHFYSSPALRPPLNPNPNPKINPANPNSLQQLGVPYPVASSGRGFVTRSLRPPDPAAVGIAYPLPHPQPVADPAMAHLHQLPHRGYPYAYPVRVAGQVGNPHSPGARQHPVPVTGAGRGAVGGVSQLKAAPSPSAVPNSNGFRSSSDGSKEDNIITIGGRKVRVVDGTSLYAICRSWLRNGQPEEGQPQEGDILKPLPRPLPLDDVQDQFPSTKEGKDVKEDEGEESVVDLSPGDLLKRHIRRAKKVRARLREERLKRIARYKTRLALLLPQQVEQY